METIHTVCFFLEVLCVLNKYMQSQFNIYLNVDKQLIIYQQRIDSTYNIAQ